MEAALLDTDILSELLKGRNQTVADNVDVYLKVHGELAISAFTHFEIVRGYRWQKATTKLAAFEQLSQSMLIYPVTASILDRAADLWADASTQGKSKMDADIIIAATALVHQRELVTGNAAHFEWIGDLSIANWR